jgi:peptidyl-prolyl cis-trans isomerase D
MLMDALREKTKLILLIVLLAFVGFIFFDWGMQGSAGRRAPSGAIAKVNGRDITYDAYRQRRQLIIQNFEARTGRAPEYADLEAIEDETWAMLLREALIQQQIEKLGIKVSDSELYEILRTAPPSFLRGDPRFQNEEGEFDPVRYGQALADPTIDWLPVETYLRATVPASKLETYIGLNARVTSAEVHERFLALNEKAQVRFVNSSPAGVELPDGAVGEADLRAYYEAHTEDFRVGEQAILEYVRIPKTPSAADSAEVREDLENIRAMIVDGTSSFAEEAKRWSEDPSAEQGGDLGFFRRGDMTEEFERVAFSLDPGEVSEVFLTPFGYHILKVEEKKTEGKQELVRARHILLKVEASNTTLHQAQNRLDDFQEALQDGADFAAAAKELGLEVETTEPFEQGSYVPGIGFVRVANQFAFLAEPGDVRTDLVENEDNFFAVRLVRRLPERILSFDEVEDRVKSLAEMEKRRELAREKLAAAIRETDGSLAAIAKAMDAAIDTTVEFSRESFVPGVGRRNAVLAAAFTLEPGVPSGLLETDRGYYVAEVLHRTPADIAQLPEQQNQIRQQLLAEKRQRMISAWLEQLMLNAEIIDYRTGRGEEWKPDAGTLQYIRVTQA